MDYGHQSPITDTCYLLSNALVRNEVLEHLEARMRELGLGPGEPIARWSIDRKLRALVESIPSDVRRAVNQAAKAMPVLQEFIEQSGKSPSRQKQT